MPLRPLNRQQVWLLPPALDELVPADHPARFVATLVDSLDESVWQKLGIEIGGDPLGAPAYHPRALLSVWLYGFMTGTRSSRKLEGACRDQVTYLWLTGWQHPDHNTLWRFYKDHRHEMRHLFKLTVKTALKMDLVDMAVQAIDGTRIAANASRDRTYDAKGLRHLLERTEQAIEKLEQENEFGDDPPPLHLPENLKQAQHLEQEVKAALANLALEGRKSINLTDTDANLMKSRQGMVVGHNMQTVVSPLREAEAGKGGMLITAVDAVSDSFDNKQLIPMMEKAQETTGVKAEMTLADAGYDSGANLAACEERHQAIAMPQAVDHEMRLPYSKDKFIHNADSDTYYCPCGQPLKYIRMALVNKTQYRVYQACGKVCRICKAFGECTNNRYGRYILIGPFDAQLRRHRAWMTTPEAQTIFSQRKQLVEPVFGIIKEQMGIRRWLLRGRANVQAEANTIATAFNLRTICRVWQSWSEEKRQKLSLFQHHVRTLLAHETQTDASYRHPVGLGHY
jgi:transposase